MFDQRKDKDLLYIPPLGGGVRDLMETGQHVRFLEGYCGAYSKSFRKIFLLSNFDESVDEYRKLGVGVPDCVTILSNKGRWHKYLFSFLAPFIFREQLKNVSVIRVSQATGSYSALWAKFWLRRPVVITYGYDYVLFASIRGFFAKQIARLHEWIARLVADHWIVTLQGLGDLIEQRLKVKKSLIHLVPNGVDLEKFSPESFKKRNSIDGSPGLRLFFMGRMEPQKDILKLMEFLNYCAETIPFELNLIGNGSLEEEIRRYANDCRFRVSFLGKINHDQLPGKMFEQDVFVSASLFEGHPKAALEAMAMGIPILVRDSPGYRFFAKDAGQLTFSGRDDFLRGLQFLSVAENRRALGLKARNYTEKNCNFTENLRKEIELLKSVQA